MVVQYFSKKNSEILSVFLSLINPIRAMKKRLKPRSNPPYCPKKKKCEKNHPKATSNCPQNEGATFR